MAENITEESQVFRMLTTVWQHMIAVLKQNAHKGTTWKCEPCGWLLDRAREEVEELQTLANAHFQVAKLLEDAPAVEHEIICRVQHEIIDVMNFLAMVYDSYEDIKNTLLEQMEGGGKDETGD